MKRGVVLSGGGTKGAFEVGVWRAMLELNLDYQVVTGTSIGSINGAMMSMMDYERCEKMWLGMQMGDLLGMPAKKKAKKAEELSKMFQLLEEYSRGRAVEKEDYFIRGAEIAAEICGLSHEKIWDMSDLSREVVESIGSAENYPDRQMIRPGFNRSFHKHLKELQKTKGSAYLLGCLCYSEAPETVDYQLMRELLMTLPREMAACLFVLSVKA